MNNTVVEMLRQARDEGRKEAFERCAAKAREFAEHYSQSSDGRNTFTILAEWADAQATTT